MISSCSTSRNRCRAAVIGITAPESSCSAAAAMPGPGVQIVKNVVGDATPADGNDVGICPANYDPTCSMAPSTTTKDKAINNTLTNIEITNVSGNG